MATHFPQPGGQVSQAVAVVVRFVLDSFPIISDENLEASVSHSRTKFNFSSLGVPHNVI